MTTYDGTVKRVDTYTQLIYFNFYGPESALAWLGDTLTLHIFLGKGSDSVTITFDDCTFRNYTWSDNYDSRDTVAVSPSGNNIYNVVLTLYDKICSTGTSKCFGSVTYTLQFVQSIICLVATAKAFVREIYTANIYSQLSYSENFKDLSLYKSNKSHKIKNKSHQRSQKYKK